jgi:hypothetical protein
MAVGTLNYTNGATGSCLISGTVQGVRTGSYTACGGTLTDTWTLPAPCPGGQPIVHTRTVTVTPAPIAAFVNAPGNITATVCGVAPQPSSLTYTNGQSGPCLITGTVMSTITGGNSANCGTYTETWTFTDACGRTIRHTRTIEVPCCTVCTLTQGAYGNPGGNTCVGGVTVSQNQIMIDALAGEPGQMKVFGRQDLNRYWVVRLSDVNQGANSNIFKMLPGGGPSRAFGVDNVGGVPEYSNSASWSIAPLQPSGPQAGSIRNQLFSQTLTLYFNLTYGDNILGTIPIAYSYTVQEPLSCGSSTPTGTPTTFSLPADVVAYLRNPANGYSATIAGLFQLANDALGGVNVGVSLNSIQEAIEAINDGFDECKILVGMSLTAPVLRPEAPVAPTTTTIADESELKVVVYPNPYENNFFNLKINSPVSGEAMIELYTIDGIKITYAKRSVFSGKEEVVRFTVPGLYKTRLVYVVTVDKHTARGVVLSPN